MAMKKILWPTDLSGRSQRALPYVRSLSEKYQTEVHVLFVMEDLAHHEGWYGNFEQNHIDRIMEWEKKKAKERLNHICKAQLEGCRLYVRHTSVGDPGGEIVKLGESEKVDAVVMATRGEKGHFHDGCVTEWVATHSSVPVKKVRIEP